MAKIYPTFTDSSYAISGYKSATYLDTFNNLILFQEKQNLVVFDTTTKKKTKIKISFGLSNACFLSETLILASSGNLVRVIDIASRQEIQQIIAPSQVTAINNYQTGFAVATKSECLTFDSNYQQTGVVELPVHEKAIISYRKLAIFSSESVRVYSLDNFSFSEYLSVGIPNDLFEYSTSEIIISTDQLKTLNLETGVVTNLDIGRNTKLYAEPSEEPAPTSSPMIFRFNTNIEGSSTSIDFELNGGYDDEISGSLNITVSSTGEEYELNIGDYKTIPLVGEGTITVNGELFGDLVDNTSNFQSYLAIYNSEAITEVVSYGEIAGLLGVGMFYSWNLVSVPDNISPFFTDLSFIFDGAFNLNDPNISQWDTSRIMHMESTFENAASFNQDISNWNTSNVLSTEAMFEGATSFNQDISSWDVSNNNVFSRMFDSATSFNQPIGSWDMSSAFTLEFMFNNASSFNSDISSWDVSNVSTLGYMFKGATSFNQPLSNWDVSGVSSIFEMFMNARSFNQDIGNWNVSNIPRSSMTRVFNNALSFNQNLTCWPVEHVLTAPTSFSVGSALLSTNLPRWGQANSNPTGRTGSSCIYNNI